MLNVLLSFAQFEREITGERIRDKIAASKKKGMWMGGNPPMGFDVIDRKLVINGDAETVRMIFSLYIEEGTVTALLDRLANEDIRTTQRAIGGKGRTISGKLFTRGHVYKLLTNPIYIGRISHKGTVHPGLHEAIIDLKTWTEVQARLTENTQGTRTRRRAVQREYLLAGLLVSERGNRFVPMHATKGSRRYRYYVEELPSPKEESGVRVEPIRLPAPEIEIAAVQAIANFLRDGGELTRQLTDLSPDQLRRVVRMAREMSANLATRDPASDRIIKSLVRRVVFRREALGVALYGSSLRRALQVNGQQEDTASGGNYRDEDKPDIALSAPIDLRRRGVQMKLVVDGERTDRTIDLPLVTAISRAYCWARMLTTGEARSIEEIAAREGIGATYIGQLLPLGCLAPALVEQALSGKQPADLTAGRLIWNMEVPLRWHG